MITNPSQLFELQRAQVNALTAVGRALIVGAEKLSTLNVAATRNVMDSATEAAQSLSGVKDPNELLALSGASAQPSLEKLVSYTRDWVGIANGVSAEIGKVVEQQISDSNRRFAELLDLAAKNAPAGSEQALALLRSAVAAGNMAFDTTSKVSRQATDWAQANFAAAAKTASSAMAAASNAATGKVAA
ncbi:MAG TPA: phasin family protein [Burkholderiaceae bacterium]|jgi:phasin family protein|nr:phasin family protein [Burkholderiaceae bacterium]